MAYLEWVWGNGPSSGRKGLTRGRLGLLVAGPDDDGGVKVQWVDTGAISGWFPSSTYSNAAA